MEGGTRDAWPGADKRAFDCQDGDGARGAWLRHLQDHATKHKQGQIPEGIGRHWGIVGRSRMVQAIPDHITEPSDAQFKAVVRMMQRLATPIRPGNQISSSERSATFIRDLSNPHSGGGFREWE